MADVSVEKFDTWLSEKLLCLNKDVDLEVFVEYITAILETDTSRDDKNESLEGIIGEIQPDDNVSEHCAEILEKWMQFTDCKDGSATLQTDSALDSAIHNLIVKQTEQAVVRKPADTEDPDRKKAILAQYGDVYEGEQSDDNEVGDAKTKSLSNSTCKSSSGPKPSAAASSASTDDILVKNMNSLLVKEREHTERERAKQESEAKRKKDKEDREKQKQKTQDRKDNEKKRTQKGEKRR